MYKKGGHMKRIPSTFQVHYQMDIRPGKRRQMIVTRWVGLNRSCRFPKDLFDSLLK